MDAGPRPTHALRDAQAPGPATTGLATVLFLFPNSPSWCLHQLGVGRAWAAFGRVAGDIHEDALLLAARTLSGRRGRGLIGVAAFRTFPPGLGVGFACWHGFLLWVKDGSVIEAPGASPYSYAAFRSRSFVHQPSFVSHIPGQIQRCRRPDKLEG